VQIFKNLNQANARSFYLIVGKNSIKSRSVSDFSRIRLRLPKQKAPPEGSAFQRKYVRDD
jgi:hypothetical protein